MTQSKTGSLRYDVDDVPPHGLAAMLGLQTVVLLISGIVLMPVVVLTTAGRPEHIEWAAFAVLIVSGVSTMLQARPLGLAGSGYALYMGMSAAFLGVCTSAVEAGGLPLLASLVIVSALVQLLFVARLSFFRRIVTPTVGGTVLMLVAVGIFPRIAEMVSAVPEGASASAAAVVAIVTFVTVVGFSLYGTGALRLWSPLGGILSGCLIAAPLGALDLSLVRDAPWFGMPAGSWPGVDLSFDERFFDLLPAFVIVVLIGGIKTYGDAIAIQRASHRGARAIDFKAVQGAMNAYGVGNVLAAIAGTLPNTPYANSASIADLTGVAARRVGLYGGLIMVVLAFVPKVAGLLRIVPEPAVGAYFLVLIVLLFRQGLRMVTADGLTHERGVIVCLSFWVGVGFENGQLFPDLLPTWSSGLFDNGMAIGSVLALGLTFLDSLRHRVGREVFDPAPASVSRLHRVLTAGAGRAGWDTAAADRLQLAGEEAFISLVERQADAGTSHPISLAVRTSGNAVELEFLSGPDAENLETRLKGLGDETAQTVEAAGLRILRHMARTVKHQQFHELDVLTVTVDSHPLR